MKLSRAIDWRFLEAQFGSVFISDAVVHTVVVSHRARASAVVPSRGARALDLDR